MLIASFSAAMADDTPVIITTGDKYQGVLPTVGIDLSVTPEERYIHPAFCRGTDIGTAVGSGDRHVTNFSPRNSEKSPFSPLFRPSDSGH